MLPPGVEQEAVGIKVFVTDVGMQEPNMSVLIDAILTDGRNETANAGYPTPTLNIAAAQAREEEIKYGFRLGSVDTTVAALLALG